MYQSPRTSTAGYFYKCHWDFTVFVGVLVSCSLQESPNSDEIPALIPMADSDTSHDTPSIFKIYFGTGAP